MVCCGGSIGHAGFKGKDFRALKRAIKGELKEQRQDRIHDLARQIVNGQGDGSKGKAQGTDRVSLSPNAKQVNHGKPEGAPGKYDVLAKVVDALKYVAGLAGGEEKGSVLGGDTDLKTNIGQPRHLAVA